MRKSTITFFDALKVATAFLLLYVGFELIITLKTVLLIFFTAVIVAIAMDQLIDQLESKKLNRVWAASLLYIIIGLCLGVLVLIFVPPLIGEIRNIITEYNTYTGTPISADEVARFDITPYIISLSSSLTDSPGAIFSTIFNTLSSITTFLAIVFTSFFLTIQKNGVRGFVLPFVPEKHREEIAVFWDKLQERVGSWLWGKTLSSLIVGFITFIGLYLLDIPYALSLAVLALFLNFIPFLGPIIAAVPAVLLGLSNSLLTAFLAGLLYFIVNSIIEAFFLSPLLMRKAIQINPAFLILSAIAGTYLGGVLGIIISIPIAAILYLIATEYRSHFRW